MSESLGPKKKGEKAPENSPEDLKTAKDIFQACMALGPGEKLPGKYVLPGKNESPATFAFEVSPEGTFIARQENATDTTSPVESYTYLELRALLREREAAGFVPYVEKAVTTTVGKKEMSSSTLRATELTNSKSEYFRQMHDMRSDKKSLRARQEKFEKIRLIERILKLGPSESEKRSEGGVVLQRGMTLPQDARIEGGPDIPKQLVPTLIIKLLQSTKKLEPNELTTPLAYPQIQILTALTDEVQSLETRDSKLKRALQETGVEQVRVLVDSWRARDGWGPPYLIPVLMCEVQIPKKNSEGGPRRLG